MQKVTVKDAPLVTLVNSYDLISNFKLRLVQLVSSSMTRPVVLYTVRQPLTGTDHWQTLCRIQTRQIYCNDNMLLLSSWITQRLLVLKPYTWRTNPSMGSTAPSRRQCRRRSFTSLAGGSIWTAAPHTGPTDLRSWMTGRKEKTKNERLWESCNGRQSSTLPIRFTFPWNFEYLELWYHVLMSPSLRMNLRYLRCSSQTRIRCKSLKNCHSRCYPIIPANFNLENVAHLTNNSFSGSTRPSLLLMNFSRA